MNNILVRVFPYNKKYAHTENLKKFNIHLACVKKDSNDTRSYIARKNDTNDELPKGTYVLFLYEKMIKGFAILQSQVRDNKSNDKDNVKVAFVENSVYILEKDIPLYDLQKKFKYEHSNQYGANFNTTKKELEEFFNIYNFNIKL